jgi:hypothetical protein
MTVAKISAKWRGSLARAAFLAGQRSRVRFNRKHPCFSIWSRESMEWQRRAAARWNKVSRRV